MSSDEEKDEPETVRLDRLGIDRAKANKERDSGDDTRSSGTLGPAGKAIDEAVGQRGDLEPDPPETSD